MTTSFLNDKSKINLHEAKKFIVEKYAPCNVLDSVWRQIAMKWNNSGYNRLSLTCYKPYTVQYFYILIKRKVIYLNKNGKTAERTKKGEKFPDFPIVVVNKAQVKRRTFHVLNLIFQLGSWKTQEFKVRMAHMGIWTRECLRCKRWTFLHVPNLMHKLL